MDAGSRLPIACTLDAAGAEEQLAAWASLRSRFRRALTTDAGIRLWFEPSTEAAVREIAAKEAACCAFLRLAVHREVDAVRLDITSDQADAQPVIALLAREAGAPAAR